MEAIPQTPPTATAVKHAPVYGVPAGEATFDPAVHLAVEQPKSNERMSMSDLALDGLKAPSNMGCAGPFALASYEGVKALRRSILQPHVLDHHMMQSAIAGPHAQLRGFAPEASKFVYDFWMHPATLAAISEAAGEELVPVFDYEVRLIRKKVYAAANPFVSTAWKHQLASSGWMGSS